MTMNEELLSKLSPEMQQRLAAIVSGQGTPEAPAAPTAQPVAPVAPPAPPKPPSLMDHLIALRQEVAALRQEQAMLGQTVSANSDVVEAVGQAVGQIYQMFQLSSQPPTQGSTFSQGFQQQEAPTNFNQEDF